MSLQVDWTDEAIGDLKDLPDWRLAEIVTNAVRRYAADGIGFVLQVPRADGPDEYRLLIPRTRTYVLIRRSSMTLYVEGVIYRQ